MRRQTKIFLRWTFILVQVKFPFVQDPKQWHTRPFWDGSVDPWFSAVRRTILQVIKYLKSGFQSFWPKQTTMTTIRVISL